jgi:para-aminobenzoate synthetase component I
VFATPRCAIHVIREIDAQDALGAYERLRSHPFPWLLDSALRMPGLGRYSFAGADPYLVLRSRGGSVTLECRRAIHAGLAVGRFAVDRPVLDVIRGLLGARSASSPPLPFAGGAVGYFGYELAQQFDAHTLTAHDDLELPDAVLLFVDALLAFDHATHRAFAVGLGFGASPSAAREHAGAAASRIACAGLGRSHAARAAAPHAVALHRPDPSAAGHAAAVEAVKREIEVGNVYQACLTHRIERPYSGDAWLLYRSLRRINPAPFACLFELPEVSIVGSSPERFFRLTSDRLVESRPIKGTRPRGRDAREDAALERELRESAKDRAENLMIVDLVRNDLGRVCETGSVHAPDLMRIEAYASVFQMVSTICGRLRADCDVLDLLRATFPPGSMTGAPKIAAMQLLDRLEGKRRAIYSGAIGYLDIRGGADLSVVIRTLFLRNGIAYLNAGGGIVADSQPQQEYAEALDKLRPLLAALAAREPELSQAARCYDSGLA